MKRAISVAVVATILASAAVATAEDAVRRLPVKVYRDKMKGAWLGQMAGVGWGQPTEFHYRGAIIPAEKMPPWKPGMVNQHDNDDCYVEMTFVKSLEDHGFDVSIRQAGIDFANSTYPLWHANAAGRGNVRKGIAPPDSGHPKFNQHADDIDYQIEADFSGILAPGMPNVVIQFGEKFGRLMNYGDGVYAGQFVGAMYAEAYFQDDVEKVVQTALKAIPAESQYAEMVRDMLRWSKDNADWEKTWQLVDDKYRKDPKYCHGLCSGPQTDTNIDVKLNGAYILMGLLYGKGDPDKTMVIACRCGQDSDCNPSNAGGVLFCMMGESKVPARFKEKLDLKRKYASSNYTFPMVLEVSEKLTRQALERSGGKIEKDDDGEAVLVIPAVAPRPSRFEPSYKPGPAANSKYNAEEMGKIRQRK